MNDKTLVKITAATAAEVCSRFDLKPAARALLSEEMGPWEFLEALVASRHYLTGIDFIAHALPPREAIWWGCLCLQHLCGDGISTLEKAACKAAVQWVLESTEGNRAAAKVQADAARPGSVAGALAWAVSQTVESRPASKTSPLSLESMAPAKAISSAVKLVTSKVEPVKITETQRLFVELGTGVAQGRFLPPSVVERLPSPKSLWNSEAGRAKAPGQPVRK
jgi:hypothetical protein